jgi:hypothetical protein
LLLDWNWKFLYKAKFFKYGGGKRDRTADPLHAMQVLSQLSYTPKRCEIIILLICCVNIINPSYYYP